jgi:competence protein ComEC
MRRPLFDPLLALMAGILTGDFIALPLLTVLTGMLVVLLVLLLCVRNQWNRAAFFLILLLLFIAGLFNIQRQLYLVHQNHHIIHQADQGQVTLEGVILSADQTSTENNALTVRCLRIIQDNSDRPVTGKLRLVVPANLLLQYGDLIRFHSKIKRIQSFHNPGSFNYERTLNRQGIYVSGFVANAAGIVLIRHNSASGIKLKLESFRLQLKQLIYANAPSPQREILEAMTIGNSKAIPQEVRDNFAKTGTSHILAISGLHVGMVAAAGFFLIFVLLKASEYLMLRFNILKVATAAAIVPVIIYALVAGMGTTVLRSTLMTLAFLTALLIGKQKDLYNILFGAALILLIIAPESLFEISFQLSFSAVFAIIYMVPRLSGWTLPLPLSAPRWLQTGIRRIYLFLLVSAAATLGTLPIIVYYFNRVSAVSLIANLIAVPLLGMLALIPAMVFILTSLFSSSLAGFLVSVSSFFAGIAVTAINRLASLSWSSFSFVKPTCFEIALFYISIFLLISAMTPSEKNHDRGFTARHPLGIRLALLVSLALIVADLTYLAWKDKSSNHLKITAIDVGQGASTLVQLPRGVNMLIDGGGYQNSPFDMGRSVIASFLYARRIKKIDIAVLTHPHPDHLQGLLYILDHFDVQEVWCTGLAVDDELYRLWMKKITQHNIRIKHLSALSQPADISGVHIRFLWPLNQPQQTDREMSYDAINDASLVLKMTYGSRSFLVTGDISSQVEAQLIVSGQNLKSDLLFVPHHGSIHSSSSDFIRAVSSRYAIISAGKNNVFRHPHPDVLNRYRSAGVEIFRTDQDGAVLVDSDGQTLFITSWIKRPEPEPSKRPVASRIPLTMEPR